jgi:hypothetical protein
MTRKEEIYKGRKSMKKFVIYAISLLTLCSPIIARADAPHELAGFVLGGRINEFKDQVEMDTVLATRYLKSLKEVEAKAIKGFKTGLVTYGTCIEPSRIVRLKFKYADNSKKFFDELLERYKANIGKPDEWRGDPFHIMIAWKWSFTDHDGNDISLILQHTTRDEEEKQGNAVKMTMWNLMLEEDHCFQQKHPEKTKGQPNFTFKDPDSVNWKLLIPR